MLKIITDSSAEFTKEEAEEMGLIIVPLTVAYGDEYFLEGVEITKDEFYERLVGGEYPHTSQPSTEQFDKAYKKCEGEECIAILISSTLSGTINSATLAKREGGYDNVTIYDSLGTTVIQRILVETAYKNRDKSAEEVAKILDELRPRIRLYAALETLEYLYKGGRIKKTTAVVGGLLGIKPIIELSKDGFVENCAKARGSKKALAEVAHRYSVAELDKDYPVYYLYCKTDDACNHLMGLTGDTDARKFNICCAVGTHIGPDAAGVVYVEKRR